MEKKILTQSSSPANNQVFPMPYDSQHLSSDSAVPEYNSLLNELEAGNHKLIKQKFDQSENEMS